MQPHPLYIYLWWVWSWSIVAQVTWYLVISRRISLIQSLRRSKSFPAFDEALDRGSGYWHQELAAFFICMVTSLFPAACHRLTPVLLGEHRYEKEQPSRLPVWSCRGLQWGGNTKSVTGLYEKTPIPSAKRAKTNVCCVSELQGRGRHSTGCPSLTQQSARIG